MENKLNILILSNLSGPYASDERKNISYHCPQSIDIEGELNILAKKSFDVLVIDAELEVLREKNLGLLYYEHIRYSMMYIHQFKPIVIFSLLSPYYHLTTSQDLVVLLSPRTKMFQFPITDNEFLQICKDVLKEELDKEKLRLYLPLKNNLQKLSQHYYRNKAGVLKLYTEYCKLVDKKEDTIIPGLTNVHYKNEIWYKRNELLIQRQGEQMDISIHKIRKRLQGEEVLLIDDQGEDGWAAVLSNILYGPQNKEVKVISSKEDALTLFSINYKERVSQIVEYEKDYYHCSTLVKQQNKKLGKANNTAKEYKVGIINLKEQITELEEEKQQIISEQLVGDDNLKKSIERVVDLSDEVNEDLIFQIKVLVKDANEATYRTENIQKINKQISQLKAKKEHLSTQLNNLEIQIVTLKKQLKDLLEKQKKLISNRPQIPEINFSLIILDLNLGKNIEDGFDVLEQIRQCNPIVPVIILTASTKAINYLKLKKLDINGFFIKNVSSIMDLFKSIENLFYIKLTPFNVWELHLGLLKLRYCDYFNGRKYYEEKGGIVKYEDILLDNNKTLIYNTLEGVLTPSFSSKDLRLMVILLGIIQEAYISYKDGGSIKYSSAFKGKVFRHDDSELKEIRNKAAHLSDWEKIPIRRMKKTVFKCFDSMIKKLYPFQ